MDAAAKEEALSSSRIALLLAGKETEHVKRYLKEEINRIESEGFVEVSNEGWRQEFKVGDRILKIAFIHGRKGEHASGADVVFELKGNKLVIIQAKKVGSDKRIHFDRLQLTKLKGLEFRLNSSHVVMLTPPDITFVSPKPAAYFNLIMSDQGGAQERLFHVLEVDGTLGSRTSLNQSEFLNKGLTEDEFHKLFYDCTIGAPDLDDKRKRDELYLYSLVTNRLVIWLHLQRPKSNVI